MEFIKTPESSNIARFGYEPANETLIVQFNNNSAYEYNGVPANIFEAMRAAESKGKFYNANIKGIFESMKL